jgi:hypothetical protein
MNICDNGKVINMEIIQQIIVVILMLFINIYYYMKNLSKIKLNLVRERLYFESLSNQLYADIATFGEDLFDVKYLIESDSKEEDTNKIVKDVVNDLKLTPKLIFTFGSGIGALHGPVTRILEGSGFSLEKKDVVLLIMTSIALLLNETDSKPLIDKVKEKGLMSALNGVKDFLSNIKTLLNTIISKVSNAAYSLSDILGFTFLLVPTMRIIENAIVENGINFSNLDYLFKGLVFATISYGIKSVFKKIGKKFS